VGGLRGSSAGWQPTPIQPPTMTRYSIQRDDGRSDDIAGRLYSSYDEAHALLERYYDDLCCSDDRIDYRIVEVADLPS